MLLACLGFETLDQLELWVRIQPFLLSSKLLGLRGILLYVYPYPHRRLLSVSRFQLFRVKNVALKWKFLGKFLKIKQCFFFFFLKCKLIEYLKK